MAWGSWVGEEALAGGCGTPGSSLRTGLGLVASQAQLTSKWAAPRRSGSPTRRSTTVHGSAGSGLRGPGGATFPIPILRASSPDRGLGSPLAAPATAGTRPPARSRTHTGNKFSLPRGGHDVLARPGTGGARGSSPALPTPRGAPAALAAPRSARPRVGCPSGRGGSGLRGAGNRSACTPRTDAPASQPRPSLLTSSNCT